MEDQRNSTVGGGVRFLKVRIAWSVGWSIACLLLITFWARSHYKIEQLLAPIGGSRYVSVVSCPNRFGFEFSDESPTNTWAVISFPTDQWIASFYLNFGAPPAILANQFSVDDGGVLMPYWFGISVAVAASMCPWLRPRFSCRALLIGMTLVAMLLGATMYVLK